MSTSEMDYNEHANTGTYRRPYSTYCIPESIPESTSSLPTRTPYKSVFTEHISTDLEYSASPPTSDEWAREPPAINRAPSPSKISPPKRRPRPLNSHTHSRSVESFTSTSSTASSSSFRKIKEFFSDTSAKLGKSRSKSNEAKVEEYYIKGSNRRFTKGDIKFQGLKSTTNYYI